MEKIVPESKELAARAGATLAKIRQVKPLIHHITNAVTIDDSANIVLCLGALPVMAHAPEEVAEMVSAAGALVLNIGTLTREQVEAMLIAGRQANKLGKPVVLDPVGAGATAMRTEAARRILAEVKVAVLRGNAAEIKAVAGAGGRIRGVESLEEREEEVRITAQAREFAHRLNTVVAITGKTDVITNGQATYLVDNGDPMLRTVVGTGCMSTSLIGAFCAVEQDHAFAAAAGLAAMGLAGERAAGQTVAPGPPGDGLPAWPGEIGPGTFKMRLFDEIYHLSSETIEAGVRIRKEDG